MCWDVLRSHVYIGKWKDDNEVGQEGGTAASGAIMKVGIIFHVSMYLWLSDAILYRYICVHYEHRKPVDV